MISEHKSSKVHVFTGLISKPGACQNYDLKSVPFSSLISSLFVSGTDFFEDVSPDLPPSLVREIRRNASVSGTGELRIKEEDEHPAIILMFPLFLCGKWQAKYCVCSWHTHGHTRRRNLAVARRERRGAKGKREEYRREHVLRMRAQKPNKSGARVRMQPYYRIHYIPPFYLICK